MVLARVPRWVGVDRKRRVDSGSVLGYEHVKNIVLLNVPSDKQRGRQRVGGSTVLEEYLSWGSLAES